ncbi:hypothetical protein ACFVKB_42765 [Rhodococcus sp. NPDC127530]|uniref:hypothetical protein n=1 Tax=unclassified Rhodococcus (in: high G+C Gram-positive bacteria) TaxID=192944 RepID=UPI003636514F
MSHIESAMLERPTLDDLLGSELDRAELEEEAARLFDGIDTTATPVAITFSILLKC